ncbi:MAG: ribonuclease D [Actinomycetota bacterium]|nr:ribonuclease D [Actinomycetota bacterium]
MYVSDGKAIRQFAKKIRGSEFITIDTEFMRERTYYARLCLIQVATDDVAAIIDPLVVDDLEPLFEILRDHGIVKVLHSGTQDLEIFHKLMGEVPAPVFDTQVAATLAGFPQQVGYGALVKEITGEVLDKSDTYTDWAKRPLSETQIEYALNDVRYLVPIYRTLRERLEDEGRLDWLEADFEWLEDPATYEIVPEEQWRRIKRISSLNRRQLGVLMTVTAWREREAQRRDIPRRWVVGDESLVEIARRAPRDASELQKIRGVGDKLGKGSHRSLIAAVTRGMELSEDKLPAFGPKRQRVRDIEGLVDLMAALVRIRAKEHKVAAPLLASRCELERLAAGEVEESPLLEGWRKSHIGDELLELLDGKISLTVVNGRLAIVGVATGKKE